MLAVSASSCFVCCPAGLTNSLSALNLVPSGTNPLAAARAGLAPTGSSLLLPMSGDMSSLRLLSSLAFLHSNLRPEDSFKQVGAGSCPDLVLAWLLALKVAMRAC